MEKKRASLARYIWLGAAVVVVTLTIWAMTPRAVEVEAVRVDRGAVRVEVVDEGRTRVHDLYVVSSPLLGVLQRVDVRAGDSVSRGAAVARIAPTGSALLDARTRRETQAAIDAARAAVRSAESRRTLAVSSHQRTASLASKGFAAIAALDRDTAALRSAEADLEAARADLRRAQAVAADGTSVKGGAVVLVKSPASGAVLRVLQESETVVMPGAPILEIGDPRSDLEVTAEFLSQDAVRMRCGSRASIENWGGPGSLPATVLTVEPYARTKTSALGVEEQRVNVILKLTPEARRAGLGQGFRVDVRVVLGETTNAVRAPVDALVRNGAGWAVFRIINGRARWTPVSVGEGNSDFRPVLSGLQEGDQVILFPGSDTKDGDHVHARQSSR